MDSLFFSYVKIMCVRRKSKSWHHDNTVKLFIRIFELQNLYSINVHARLDPLGLVKSYYTYNK